MPYCMVIHFLCFCEWRYSCGEDKLLWSSQCWSCANIVSVMCADVQLNTFCACVCDMDHESAIKYHYYYYFVESKSQASRVRIESESSKIFRVESESWPDRFESESSHKNCWVTSSHLFVNSSQCRVTGNLTFFRQHIFAMKWRPTC